MWVKQKICAVGCAAIFQTTTPVFENKISPEYLLRFLAGMRRRTRAFLMECVEIRRLWPAYNSSLKRFEQRYGLYVYEDQAGYLRLTIEKKKQNLPAYYEFQRTGRRLADMCANW